MLIDKFKAKKNLWRIPEKVLFATALLGGSLGVIGGMHAARHKTKHLSFSMGVPILLAIQIVAVILFFIR